MENFDHQQQDNMREKQFYLLHLDTPRIIIVSSVIIGLIVISFLMGMNFIGDNGDSQQIAATKTFGTEERSANLLDESIPSPPHENLDKNPFEDKIIAGDEKTPVALKDKKKEKKAGEKIASADVLSSEDINEIIPPLPEEKKTIAKKKKIVKKKKKSTRVVRKKKSSRKRVAKKKKRRGRVIEVSDNTFRRTKSRSGYAIQVCSFDTKNKAKREAGRLRKMNYDTYIQNSRVSGKRYYRVRIGPVSSKKKAVRLLNDMQGIDRYSASYMIKE